MYEPHGPLAAGAGHVPATDRDHPAAFDRLLTELEPRYQQADAKRKGRPSRKPKPDASSPSRRLMLPMCYRTYTTHAFVEFPFGIDDRSVGRKVDPLQPLLAGLCRIPERRVELEPDEIRELFFAAPERPLPRPTRRQKRFHSGKEKRPTLEHPVVVVRALVRARSTPQAMALRCRIVSIAAQPEQPTNRRAADALDGNRRTVGRWRERYVVHGSTGLQGAPRSGRPRSFSPRTTTPSRHTRQ